MFPKLYIYDASSEEDRDQAAIRFDDDDNVVYLGATSKTHLLQELNRHVIARSYFSRVLVQTHGVPGAIMINDKSIWDITLKSDFAGGGFHRLFPHYTMIYFDGCNCAKGSLGDEFLEAVGQIFLRNAGGEVRGWTSYGYGITWDVPFIGGHTIHFSGEAKTAYFRPGGVSYVPPRVKVEKEPIEHGFKI